MASAQFSDNAWLTVCGCSDTLNLPTRQEGQSLLERSAIMDSVAHHLRLRGIVICSATLVAACAFWLWKGCQEGGRATRLTSASHAQGMQVGAEGADPSLDAPERSLASGSDSGRHLSQSDGLGVVEVILAQSAPLDAGDSVMVSLEARSLGVWGFNDSQAMRTSCCRFEGVPYGEHRIILRVNSVPMVVSEVRHFSPLTRTSLHYTGAPPQFCINITNATATSDLSISNAAAAHWSYSVADSLIRISGVGIDGGHAIVEDATSGMRGRCYIPPLDRFSGEVIPASLRPPGRLALSVSSVSPKSIVRVAPSPLVKGFLASSQIVDDGGCLATSVSLPAGEYVVIIDDALGRSVGIRDAESRIASKVAQALTVVVMPGQETRLAVVSDSMRRLTGRVLRNGEPLSGVKVALDVRERHSLGAGGVALGMQRAHARTRADGQFQISYPSDWVVATASAFDLGLCAAHTVNVATADNIDLELSPASWVSGSCEGDAVRATNEASGEVSYATFCQGQMFSMGPLPAGIYRFELLKGNVVISLQSIDVQPPASMVVLKAPADHYFFTLPRPIAMNLNVQVGGSAARIDAGQLQCAIELRHPGGEAQLATCSVGGAQYSLVLDRITGSPNEYLLPDLASTLHVSAPASEQSYCATLTAQGGVSAVVKTVRLPLNTDVPVPAGSYLLQVRDAADSRWRPCKPIVVEVGAAMHYAWSPPQMAKVNIQVLSSAGLPMSDVKVVVGDGTSASSPMVQTDAAGLASVDAVVAPAWRVYVISYPPTQAASLAFSQSGLDQGVSIPAPNSGQSHVQVRLPY